MKKHIIHLVIIGVVIFLIQSTLSSCLQKETFSKAVIETNQITSITEISAIAGGFISSDGGSIVTMRGVCWSTLPNPTIENDTTVDAAGTGMFNSTLKGLTPATTYYVRAYAVNKGGVVYGLQMNFTTKIFSITTTPIDTTLVTINSAICGGNIFYDVESNSLNILTRGVCWDTFPLPTISKSKISLNGANVGKYSCLIDNLKSSTTYYVRAFASYNGGTIYGNEVSFATRFFDTTWRDNNLAFFNGLASHSDIKKIIDPKNDKQFVFYKVLTPSTGSMPNIGKIVKITYAIWLWSENLKYNNSLDLVNSIDNNQTGYSCTVGSGIIEGLSLALQQMPIGSKWRIFIPYYLAYGTTKTSNIPAYSTLIIDVTLKEITS